MKKKLLYTTIITGLIFSSSCKKDYLSLSPESSLTSVTFFKTKDHFVQAVNGAYNPLLAMYNTQLWRYAEMRSDNTTFQYQTDASVLETRNFDQFLEGRNYADGFFQTSYQGITRCNTVIERLPGSSLTAADKAQLAGEASFLRALYYFHLVRLYGQLPLVLGEVTSIDQAYEVSKVKASVADIYTQIIKDATFAANNLPATYIAADRGRATKYAAKTLLADVYLTNKQYDLAITQLTGTDGVIGKYSLMGSYAQNYGGTPASENNAESIFEVQFVSSATIAGLNSSLNDQFVPFDVPAPYAPTGGLRPANLVNSGYNIPTRDMLAAYETGDARRAASVNETYISGGQVVPYVIKYNGAHSIAGQYGNNFPVYRYAEALLIAAECYNQSGTQANDATARGYLNQVRQRANLLPNLSSTGASLFDAIIRERRVELAFENKRWFDLVRTGTAASVLTAEGVRQKAQFPLTVPPTAYSDIRLLFVYPDRDAMLIAGRG